MVEHTTDSYNRSAETYEQRWDRYLQHTHRRFIDNLQTNSADILLDASCGTGLLAQELVEESHPFAKLVLNDIAEQMQHKARERLTDQPGVTFTQYAWPHSHFDPHTFTKIFCLNAFHNYPDQQQVINHFAELLQPGGELLILDWNNSGLFKPVNWMIKQWVRETINTKSLSQVQKMLQKANFRIADKKSWHFKYWRFYFIKAVKSSS